MCITTHVYTTFITKRMTQLAHFPEEHILLSVLPKLFKSIQSESQITVMTIFLIFFISSELNTVVGPNLSYSIYCTILYCYVFSTSLRVLKKTETFLGLHSQSSAQYLKSSRYQLISA